MTRLIIKKIVSVVLIVSMVFTTGGFATLADSVSNVVETTRREDAESKPHKYYDDLISENTNTTSVGENTDTKGVNDDAGSKLSEPEEKEDDEPSSNEYTEEPEDDETTVSSDTEQDFDGEETTTVEVTTEGLTSETTVIVNEETTTNKKEEPTSITIISEETTTNTSEETTSTSKETTIIAPTSSIEDTTTNASEEQTSATIISEETTTTEPTTVVPTEITNTESSSTATGSEISDAENQTENNISTSSDIAEDKLTEETNIVATDSEANNTNTASESEIKLTELVEIKTASKSELFGALPSHIWFGTYPQNDTNGIQFEPIKWRVLNSGGNELLLIAENILDNVSYYSPSTYSPLWRDSEIRTWLNGTFKTKAFTNNQINDGIIEKSIFTDNEAITSDKILLITLEDANNYFANDEDKKAIASNYARSVVNNGGTLEVYNGYSPWWLRGKQFLPDIGEQQIIIRPYDGRRDYVTADSHRTGVRPAIYANLSSTIFSSQSNNIHFNLNGASWKTESALWGEMTTYQGGQKLPTAYNLNLPTDKYFAGWTYSDDPDTIITEIATDKTGDITLNAKLIDGASITWDLEDGNTGNVGAWVGVPPLDRYGYGIGLPSLPINVDGPGDRFFDHWEINGTQVSSIEATDTGSKTIKAVYADFPQYIWLGTYPQNSTNSDTVEPVKWRVLSKDGNELLLLSDKILDNVSFHSIDTVGTSDWVTWRDSDIRSWLNNDFKLKMFPQNQINNLIKEKHIITNNYHYNNGPYDCETDDKIILLHKTDVYAWSSTERKTEGTTYAAAKENYGMRLDTYYHDGYYPWWLRGESRWYSSTNLNDPPVYDIVNEAGDLRTGRGGHSSERGTGGVRPALYIDMSSSTFLTPQNTLTWEFESQFSGVSVSFNEVSSLWNEKNTYFAGDILPKENNLTLPEGYTLHGWYINDNYDTIYTAIPTDMSGEITVRPHLEPTVTWDLGIYGEWVSGNPPFTVATYGEVQTLPDVSAITVNNTVSFYQWTIDGIEATSIEANRTRPVKVIAQYKYANELLFGAFPQSSTDYSADDPIRWIVLSTDNNKQLLISERVLNEMQFASGDVRYFGGTPVKNWLNDEFYNKSFKDFEKSAISDNIINESYYHEDQGFTVITYPTTTCKVRLLSRDEWNGYRPPVSYDNTHGTEKNYWTCTYVGRYDTPTWYKNIYMYDAETNDIVTNSKYNQSGVRPVINIDLNNEFFNATESNITWQLGEDVGFFEGSTWNYFVKYREGYEQKLPTDGNFAVKPNGKVLIGWFVDDGTKLIAARSVPKEMRGDITLTPIWGTEGQKLIKYNLYNKDTGEYGRFTTEPPYVYTPGTALTLPDVSTAETPSGNQVARWQRDNNVVTHIPSTETSDVEVFADFNATGVCKIGYDLGNGHFNIATPSERVIGTDFIIPASTSVVPPVGYKFSHWILKTESGDILSDNATYVSGEYVGNVNVVAVYDNLIYNIT
ncbi:MAG: hypothetical protein J6M39_05140, partial [Lachnospiraceae bacterium]|nr:hypothetical protein [Lachnospiraceae bacterium]